MLKRKLCEVTFQWELKCKGPLLIRDERYVNYKGNKKDGFPDCLFMSHASEKEIETTARHCNNNPPSMSFYVPATSIRGPFRAQAERIIRSLMPEDTPHPFTACDPLEQDEKNHNKTLGCSSRLENENKDKSKYATVCPACKLFGCAGLASRIYFTDADIEEGYRSAYRDMIGIDRFTGGVHKGSGTDSVNSGANMRFHVLENTIFTTTVTVTNFELWQLGLLAYVFRDFETGLVPIGFGKTKGFGLVQGNVTEITLKYPSVIPHIEHMGTLMNSATERDYYGIHTCEAPLFEHIKPINGGLSLYKNVNVTNIPAFWVELAAKFNNSYIEELNRLAKENLT